LYRVPNDNFSGAVHKPFTPHASKLPASSGTLFNMTRKIRLTVHTDHRNHQAAGRYHRMAALLQEREQLREEIRQLSAAVQIYTEIVRRLETVTSTRSAA
jgi:hypothetical protein